MKSKKFLVRTIPTAILLIIAILSLFVFSNIATSPEFHNSTIETLDSKRNNVLALTTATATTSVLVAAIPGDATTPIANQLTELSSYLIIVVCAIFLEKVLLTLTGLLTFKILIPIVCLLLIVYLYTNKTSFKTLAIKLLIFGLATFLLIPASTAISDLIDITFNTQETIDIANQGQNEITNVTKDASSEKKTVVSEIVKALKKLSDDVIPQAISTAKEVLNNFIDAIAALVITSCIIPICVILLYIWLINFIFGLNINIDISKAAKAITNTTYHSKKKPTEQVKALDTIDAV